MPYLLTDPDGARHPSEVPGTLGGNATLRIYGRLDCARAVAALPLGYARHRVFFADEDAAISAGYRPCARCLPERYALWKAGPTGLSPYPWHIVPHHPVAGPVPLA